MNINKNVFYGIFFSLLITFFSFYFTHIKFDLNHKFRGFYLESVLYISAIFLIFVFTKLKYMSFNFSRISILIVLKIALFTFILSFFLQILSGLTALIFARPFSNEFDKSTTWQILMILLASPLFFELMFRGFLLNMIKALRFKQVIISKKISVSYSSIISGIVSGGIVFLYLFIENNLLIVSLTAFSSIIIGIIAGYYQEKYNNFSAALVVSYTNNLISIIGVIIAIIFQ